MSLDDDIGIFGTGRLAEIYQTLDSHYTLCEAEQKQKESELARIAEEKLREAEAKKRAKELQLPLYVRISKKTGLDKVWNGIEKIANGAKDRIEEYQEREHLSFFEFIHKKMGSLSRYEGGQPDHIYRALGWTGAILPGELPTELRPEDN